MTSPYRIRLSELEESAHVPAEEQVEEHDVTPPVPPDAYDEDGSRRRPHHSP